MVKRMDLKDGAKMFRLKDSLHHLHVTLSKILHIPCFLFSKMGLIMQSVLYVVEEIK